MTDYFALSRQIAYQGDIGKQREAFCITYIKRKQRMFAEMQLVQTENTAAIGETISCGKGCTHCCLEYVEATLQEGEAIVYFLYQHDDILDRFVKAYPAWKRKVSRSGDFLKEATGPGCAEIDEYAGHKIPCPFLHRGICSIYEIRPLTCAGLIATTPRECCDPACENKSKSRYQTARGKDLYDLSFYRHDLERPVQAFMPVMVYNILKYGFVAQIGGIPGLEDVISKYADDPAVKASIKKFRKTHQSKR